MRQIAFALFNSQLSPYRNLKEIHSDVNRNAKTTVAYSVWMQCQPMADCGLAVPVRGKSQTCRLAIRRCLVSDLRSTVIDRECLVELTASQRLAAHQNGGAIRDSQRPSAHQTAEPQAIHFKSRPVAHHLAVGADERMSDSKKAAHEESPFAITIESRGGPCVRPTWVHTQVRPYKPTPGSSDTPICQSR